jgi:dTDP-4-amino-4,6-dideoxygalactose transaminase
MTKIPLIKPDLPSLDEIQAQLCEILDNGRITNFGKYVATFEEEASAYLGTHTATLSSGTMGLIFALQAVGLKPGQKVILPSFTFMATAQAVLYAGGVPVFADCEGDLTLSTSDLEMLLARHKDVAVVIGTHVYGMPCRVDAIQSLVDEFARRRSQPIAVLYDAAHAFGSAINERKVGGFGDIEVFSLSVTKVLVSVEGGMVSSRNPKLVNQICKMRNYGIEDNYNARYRGLNGKMSEFHAIIGLHNLRRIETLLNERQRKARYFIECIGKHTSFEVLPWPDGIMHTFKDFTILVPEEQTRRRDAVMTFLKERGVETRAYFYPPVHEQWHFWQFSNRPLPRTESLSRRVVTLPFYTSITEAEMDYVVDALAEAERKLELK